MQSENNMEEIKNKYFELVISVKDELERFAVFLTRNRDTAKELVSASIVSGFDTYKNLKNQDAFKYFLFRICSREYYKIKKRNRKYGELNEEELMSFYSDTNPDELYDIGLLYNAIDKLKKIDKEILVLGELMGYKYAEISAIFGISEANVKVKIFRSKQKIKEFLRDK